MLRKVSAASFRFLVSVPVSGFLREDPQIHAHGNLQRSGIHNLFA
jgi:hypothetical protein